MFCDHHGQLGPFEAPAADPSPGEVEPSNIDEGLPGPPDAYPGTTSEPMVMESLEHFSVPVPDSEEVGAGERVGTPKRPQDVPGIVEVCRDLVKRITWYLPLAHHDRVWVKVPPHIP